jgi:hypothetical protein
MAGDAAPRFKKAAAAQNAGDKRAGKKTTRRLDAPVASKSPAASPAAASDAAGTKTAPRARSGSAGKTKVDPYVVIVRNAEVDLSAIHAESIARFVMPKPDKADTVPADSRVASVTVRQETLTALVRYDPRAYSITPEQVVEEVGKRTLLGRPVRVVGTDSARKRNLQGELSRATLSTSKNVSAEELTGHLKDVPGFVGCRKVRAQVFHAVFANADTLLRTKMLLDEFESDGLRITVQLNSALDDTFSSFTRAQNEVAGLEEDA